MHFCWVCIVNLSATPLTMTVTITPRILSCLAQNQVVYPKRRTIRPFTNQNSFIKTDPIQTHHRRIISLPPTPEICPNLLRPTGISPTILLHRSRRRRRSSSSRHLLPRLLARLSSRRRGGRCGSCRRRAAVFERGGHGRWRVLGGGRGGGCCWWLGFLLLRGRSQCVARYLAEKGKEKGGDGRRHTALGL